MRSHVIAALSALVFLAPAAAPQTKPGGSGSSSQGSTAPPNEVAGKTFKQWLTDLKSRDPSVKENALRTVGYFGKAGRDAIGPMIDCLKDPDAGVRVHACLHLMQFIPLMEAAEIQKAVDSLAYRVNSDAQAIVRYHAAQTLSAFGSEARPAIPALLNRIGDPSTWQMRKGVIIALSTAATDAKAGPDSRAVRAISHVLLKGDDAREMSSQVRLEAAIALGRMGRPLPQDQPQAVAALQRALKDPDKSVTIWAWVSLMAIDKVTDEGLNALTKHLKGKDVLPKVEAARALAAMGRDAKTRVPDLIALLDDRELLVVATGAWSLGEMGIYAGSAVSSLNALAEKKDQHEYIKEVAKEAVQKINGNKKS